MQGAQRIERSAALLGSTLCIALAAVTWRSVSESQETWPFPALYFVELMTLGVVVATAYLRPSTSRAWIALAAAGAILAFCILGAWTVGLLFLPAGAAIAAAALITAVRHQERLGAHCGHIRRSGPISGRADAWHGHDVLAAYGDQRIGEPDE